MIISWKPSQGQQQVLGAGVFKIDLQKDYYFPKGVEFDSDIPSPAQFLGRDIGKFHTHYEQIIQYFKELERKSDRARLDTIGYTWEGRPLIVLKISANKNIQGLERIHQQHIWQIDRAKTGLVDSLSNNPTIVFLGFSVHGNESSPAESSLLTAYYLTAGRGTEVEKYLENAVYFIDPVRNPDGYERYVTWVNANSVFPPIGDPLDREHNEAWPGGRTNHYWFDLNRDWVNQIHPESKARVTYFQKWLPHVQGDFHEMNAASSFFFEPTKPDAQESIWVPKSTYELNNVFARYYAAALDTIGSLYYTKEQYDNINPTYGSSYPDHVGSLGILFEQASPRGLLQHTASGELTYPFAIRNHLRIALATIRAAVENREQLQRNQLQFFKSALDLAAKDPLKGYLIDAKYNRRAVEHFAELLRRHQITFRINQEDRQVGNLRFEKERSLWIPTAQPNYRLVKVIFDEEKEYVDSVFYDGSGNSVAYLYGFAYAGLKENITTGSADDIANLWHVKNATWTETNFGYLVDWRQDAAPWLLAQLLRQNIVVKAAASPFEALLEKKPVSFGYGSLFIPTAGQSHTVDSLNRLLQQLSVSGKVKIDPIRTGFSISGIDLGSNGFKIVKPQNALLVTGRGVRAYEAGEVWYSFERQLQYPLVRVNAEQFGEVNLDRFQVLILTGGEYSSFNQNLLDKIRNWTRAGGTFIVFGRTGQWLAEKELTSFKFAKDRTPPEEIKEKNRYPYASAVNRQGAEHIGGTFFKTEIDVTHPIGYGYTRAEKAVFRNHALFVEQGEQPYHNVSIYSKSPLLNGYVSAANQQRLEGTASILVETNGAGRTIYFVEDPVFRGVSFGNARSFFNAVFFGQIIQPQDRR